ncbi:hypothetical protein WR25_17210 [Diploscapter pachys]|uniref:Uncharacterized protein n=1 Tax=Diploscapter pachys TaxID=2018661 RepID=A0A2A2JVI0_9BILA|nr:hypothetical protein WR25_17210 [Diploscapter pachys]
MKYASYDLKKILKSDDFHEEWMSRVDEARLLNHTSPINIINSITPCQLLFGEIGGDRRKRERKGKEGPQGHTIGGKQWTLQPLNV